MALTLRRVKAISDEPKNNIILSHNLELAAAYIPQIIRDKNSKKRKTNEVLECSSLSWKKKDLPMGESLSTQYVIFCLQRS